MNKPTNPNVIVPAAFALNGTKRNFSNEKIQSGFDQDAADVLAGDNLNKFIDDTYKSINYSNAGVSDLYKSAVLYDGTETYYTNAIVFNVENDNVSLYRSLADNNTGNPLTANTKWQQVQLGADILDLVQPIGSPIFMAKNAFPDGLDAANSSYIWLNGAAVSRTTYASLFAVYGTTYGSGDGSTTFNLPNAAGRYIYCDNSFGYISAGIPDLGLKAVSNGKHKHDRGNMNISGWFGWVPDYQVDGSVFTIRNTGTSNATGAGDRQASVSFNANGNWTGYTNETGAHEHTISATNSLYKATNALQVAGIKYKVCTRWR